MACNKTEGRGLLTTKRDTYVRAYTQKTRAELASLERAGVRTTGNAFSPILFCKGLPNEAEKTGRVDPFGGSDGKALRAAITALGYAPEHWAGLATWAADGTEPLDAGLLRQAVMALDPATLVACDDEAAAGLCAAFDDDALLMPGQVAIVCGMRALALGGFEAALEDARAKQLMWARLKLVPPLAGPY